MSIINTSRLLVRLRSMWLEALIIMIGLVLIVFNIGATAQDSEVSSLEVIQGSYSGSNVVMDISNNTYAKVSFKCYIGIDSEYNDVIRVKNSTEEVKEVRVEYAKDIENNLTSGSSSIYFDAANEELMKLEIADGYPIDRKIDNTISIPPVSEIPIDINIDCGSDMKAGESLKFLIKIS